jgi:hypothetical protein
VRKAWLSDRAKLLEQYANAIPSLDDKVSLQMDFPKYGWIDMHIAINDEEKIVINASNVYEPFGDIREWLENIVNHIFDFIPYGMNICCEAYNVILYYDPILYQDDELLFMGDAQLCGIFYIYDGYSRKIVTNGFCETKELVRAFYSTIVAYANNVRERDDFIDHWVEGAYNEEWGSLGDDDPAIKDIFINKIKSPIIEKFLYDENATTRFIPVKLK